MFGNSASMSHVSSQNVVLRDTYRLLSMTLIWSAFTAYLGMLAPVPPIASLGLFIVAIALLFATSHYRNSGVGVALVFGFTGLMGFNLGPTLNHYLALSNGAEVVGMSLLGTGAAFLGLSAYVHVSKKDFSFLGGYLITALIGVLVVSLVGMFVHVPGMSMVLSYVTVLLFSGYILYDTSNIVAGRETNYIMATISLYLDILNMFTAMLRIFSGRD